MLKLVPEILTYTKFLINYLSKKIDYRGINRIKIVLKMVLKYIKNILLQIEKKEL